MASDFHSYHSDSHSDEPSLDELFAEPIIQRLMQRDGVQLQDVRLQMDRLVAACPA